jgi:hypothetical protein
MGGPKPGPLGRPTKVRIGRKPRRKVPEQAVSGILRLDRSGVVIRVFSGPDEIGKLRLNAEGLIWYPIDRSTVRVFRWKDPKMRLQG